MFHKHKQTTPHRTREVNNKHKHIIHFVLIRNIKYNNILKETI